MRKKRQSIDLNGLLMLLVLGIIAGLTFLGIWLVKKFKIWIENNPWWTLVIITILTTVFIMVSGLLILKFFKNKKSFNNKITVLQTKIAHYEKIYPNLRNYEHETNVSNDLKISAGNIGELVVKTILATIADQENALLFNNLYLKSFDNNVNQIDHILLTNNCIFVIETKNWQLDTYGCYSEKQWLQYHGSKREFVNSPIEQNIGHVKTLNRVLQKHNFNPNQINIFNVVVFVQNNLKMKTANQLVANQKALNLLDLTDYIKQMIKDNYERPLSLLNYKNQIARIILENNQYENIKLHKEQLNY